VLKAQVSHFLSIASKENRQALRGFMFYEKWLSYIDGNVRLKDVVIPGAHNALSYGMGRLAKCQDHNLYEQYKHGVRFFCIRLFTDKNNVICASHGFAGGEPFEESIKDLSRIVKEAETEFLILDIRPYYNKKIGPFTIRFNVDQNALDSLIEQYLDPTQYALIDDNVPLLTMSQIRQSGKRYVIANDLMQIKASAMKGDSIENYRIESKFGSNFPCVLLWDKEIYGFLASQFVKAAPSLLEKKDIDALIWFQVQQTPNLNSEIGITSPGHLDTKLKRHFDTLIKKIRETPEYLKNANVICGDFMTRGIYKSREIIRLNLDKGKVANEFIEEFTRSLDTKD
jgi:hypothetical protein